MDPSRSSRPLFRRKQLWQFNAHVLSQYLEQLYDTGTRTPLSREVTSGKTEPSGASVSASHWGHQGKRFPLGLEQGGGRNFSKATSWKNNSENLGAKGDVPCDPISAERRRWHRGCSLWIPRIVPAGSKAIHFRNRHSRNKEVTFNLSSQKLSNRGRQIKNIFFFGPEHCGAIQVHNLRSGVIMGSQAKETFETRFNYIFCKPGQSQLTK